MRKCLLDSEEANVKMWAEGAVICSTTQKPASLGQKTTSIMESVCFGHHVQACVPNGYRIISAVRLSCQSRIQFFFSESTSADAVAHYLQVHGLVRHKLAEETSIAR